MRAERDEGGPRTGQRREVLSSAGRSSSICHAPSPWPYVGGSRTTPSYRRPRRRSRRTKARASSISHRIGASARPDSSALWRAQATPDARRRHGRPGAALRAGECRAARVGEQRQDLRRAAQPRRRVTPGLSSQVQVAACSGNTPTWPPAAGRHSSVRLAARTGHGSRAAPRTQAPFDHLRVGFAQSRGREVAVQRRRRRGPVDDHVAEALQPTPVAAVQELEVRHAAIVARARRAVQTRSTSAKSEKKGRRVKYLDML